MPKSKYEDIYLDLKRKIENNTYPRQELLPAENTLIQIYDCSRNTVRRAIARLVTDGYVQTLQGKGVRNIYRPAEQTSFYMGVLETLNESAQRNGFSSFSKVLHFEEKVVDEPLHKLTSFPIGAVIYYIQRLHYLNDSPLIINHNYFLKECIPGLTPEIAETSIYDYLENTLHMTIVNAQRFMSVDKITELDQTHLSLNAEEYNCMAVVSSFTYNSDGIMFEFTQSRHRPDTFCFRDNAVRKPIG